MGDRMDQGAYATMTFERDGHVLTVRLRDSAELEGKDAEIHSELRWLFHDLRREREARAVVLTGSGDVFFGGLNDPVGALLWIRQAGLEVIDEERRIALGLIHDLLEVEIPIVVALNGDTTTLGTSIMLLCDAVFVADTAMISDPHVRIGVAAGDGGQFAWPMAVGPLLAKRYLLTGDPVDARRAADLGMVTDVCSPETVLEEATAFAHRLAGSAPLAIRYTKMAVNRFIKDVMRGAFEQGLDHELRTFTSEDMAEALTATREGRAPEFNGR